MTDNNPILYVLWVLAIMGILAIFSYLTHNDDERLARAQALELQERHEFCAKCTAEYCYWREFVWFQTSVVDDCRTGSWHVEAR